MSYQGFKGRTMCLADRHLLADPETIGVDVRSGRRFCRLCHSERRLRSLRDTQRRCATCGTELRLGTTWRWCSTPCMNSYKKRRPQTVDIEDNGRTLRLLALHDELERAAMSWERADIQRQIDALMAEQTMRETGG